MPAKKPGTKLTKPKKAATPKVAARRPEPPRPAAASRKAVAATSAKPAVKPAPKAAVAAKGDGRAAPRPGAASSAPLSHGPAATEVRPAAATAPRVIQVPPDSDDGDSGEPSSLLAGPRNVKPYVAKRGEQYMSKEQLSHFQQILLNWKRDLMEEVDRTVSHMKDEAANFPDPNDRATQEEEFSLELRTRDRERKLIRKIEEALKRIEDGTYGYCLETGEEIGIKRLEARPVATLSIEAQERRERRERQYGDRDDRYR
jgi:RNA polymerase-binding transcription factor